VVEKKQILMHHILMTHIVIILVEQKVVGKENNLMHHILMNQILMRLPLRISTTV